MCFVSCRCMQLVHIDKSVKMLDSPGIIAGSLNSAVSLALRSASEMEELVNPLEAVNALLKHCNKQQVPGIWCAFFFFLNLYLSRKAGGHRYMTHSYTTDLNSQDRLK